MGKVHIQDYLERVSETCIQVAVIGKTLVWPLRFSKNDFESLQLSTLPCTLYNTACLPAGG